MQESLETVSGRPLSLSDHERAMLEGEQGEAMRLAMQLVVRAARIMDAPRLLEARYLHIDACHYYGRAHVDFARYLVGRNVRFRIPAWTNTIPASLIQNEMREDADPGFLAEARELADLYVRMGANPVWTCAPYQLPGGPGFGEHIVVAESNAVSYFNSVVGARTNRYGDFLDVACGLTERVPEAGLHIDEGRRARLHIDLDAVPGPLRETEFFCHVLGHLMGRVSGDRVPVITGLPTTTTGDNLKALAAAGGASGAVGLFHAVGVTPEAPSLEAALQGRAAEAVYRVTPDRLIEARASLSTAAAGKIDMVALGTPHFSFTEFSRLVLLLDGRKIHPDVAFYVSTSRHVAALAGEKGWIEALEQAGATVLVDTCTYFSPAVRGCKGRVMTNSAKWAYYAPGMLPVKVAFGSLEDCVESAVRGEVTRDPATWSARYWGADR